MVTRSLEQLVGVLLGVEQRGSVHQSLGRAPHGVRDGLLRVDPQQVLKNRQKRDLLRRVGHLQ